MSPHTPGPLRVIGKHICTEKKLALARMTLAAAPGDARLFAACPELLAALETLALRAAHAGFNSEDAHQKDFDALKQARAALARATQP